MDNKKVAGVNDVQEQCTDKSANVESVSHDTVDVVALKEALLDRSNMFKGFRNKNKPVGIDFWGFGSKIARKLK